METHETQIPIYCEREISSTFFKSLFSKFEISRRLLCKIFTQKIGAIQTLEFP